MAARAFAKVFEAMEEFERETPIWERKKAGEIKGELLELTRAVLKKYSLADDAKKTRYFIAQPSRMLKRELSRWNTLCLRGMKVQVYIYLSRRYHGANEKSWPEILDRIISATIKTFQEQ